MNSSAKKTDTALFGLGLGVWLELGLLGYLHATFAYIVRRTTDYVLKTTIFESGGCRAGFTTQEVPTTTGSAYMCISGLGWALEHGLKLSFVMLSACVAGLALALVRRARDAGVTFHWPSSRSQDSPSSTTEKRADNQTTFMHHPNHFGVYIMLYMYAVFTLVQIGVMLLQVKRAFTDTCPHGLYAHESGSKKVHCFGPAYVQMWATIQVALGLIVIPAAWLAGRLLYRDNFIPEIVVKRPTRAVAG